MIGVAPIEPQRRRMRTLTCIRGPIRRLVFLLLKPNTDCCLDAIRCPYFNNVLGRNRRFLVRVGHSKRGVASELSVDMLPCSLLANLSRKPESGDTGEIVPPGCAVLIVNTALNDL